MLTKPKEPEVERIVQAAIECDGRAYSVSQPGRHHDVIRSICAHTGADPVIGEQGFITSRSRFVDRVEAAQIAVAAGQILPFQNGGLVATRTKIEKLYSEDVW